MERRTPLPAGRETIALPPRPIANTFVILKNGRICRKHKLRRVSGNLFYFSFLATLFRSLKDLFYCFFSNFKISIFSETFYMFPQLLFSFLQNRTNLDGHFKAAAPPAFSLLYAIFFANFFLTEWRRSVPLRPWRGWCRARLGVSPCVRWRRLCRRYDRPWSSPMRPARTSRSQWSFRPTDPERRSR